MWQGDSWGWEKGQPGHETASLIGYNAERGLNSMTRVLQSAKSCSWPELCRTSNFRVFFALAIRRFPDLKRGKIAQIKWEKSSFN
jgi:hypothetical protein